MAPASRPGRPALPRQVPYGLALLAGVFTIVMTVHYGAIFREVWRLRTYNPRTTAFMESGLERLRESDPRARLQHPWVPYARISEHLKRAVIAAEDQRFLDHDGFDVDEIEAAFQTNSRRGEIHRGASTISQQLAKNLFLSNRRTYMRKADEAVITMMLERLLGKRRILEIYLNVIEWGDGIYGAEAAARTYYDESASELEPNEAASLAAMIPNPRYYALNRKLPYLKERIQFLLREMGEVRIP